jgi:hypothetical protein
MAIGKKVGDLSPMGNRVEPFFYFASEGHYVINAFQLLLTKTQRHAKLS